MTRNNRNRRVADYFHRNIKKFDDIYSEDKKTVLSILNRIVRASVKARFNFAFDILGNLSGKSVLDIGCGSGRYMFRAAQGNAEHIVGIDAARGALEEARKIAGDLGLENKMEFIEGDFLDCTLDRKFEVIFAVGYFDYIFNPADHLIKMVKLSNGVIYASFPRRWNLLTITRKIRLALNRCPVRFYSKKNIFDVMRQAGIENFELKSIFRDYILIIRK